MKALITALLIFAAFTTFSQQDYLNSMYWNQYAQLNPATSALDHKMDARFNYRNQLPSLTGNLRTYSANFNMLLGDKHGVGINYNADKIVFTESNTLQLNYNYQFKFKNDRKISIGISPGIRNLKINGDWIPPTQTDDVLIPAAINETKFNLNAGVAYSGKSLYGGIGVTHITAQRYVGENGITAFKTARHYYAHLRYTKAITPKLALVGEGVISSTGGFNTFNINLKTFFLNRFWLGAGYRNARTFSAFAGWDIKKKFHLAYSYDFTKSILNQGVSGGSHEFTLGFQIPHIDSTPSGRAIHGPDF